MQRLLIFFLFISVACRYENEKQNNAAFLGITEKTIDNLEEPFTAFVRMASFSDGKSRVVVFVEKGFAVVGDTIELVGYGFNNEKHIISKIGPERFETDTAKRGELTVIWFNESKEIKPVKGVVISKVGSIGSFSEFEAFALILDKDEGGRHIPFFNSYRPSFYFGGTNITGKITLEPEREMVMPGDVCDMNVKLEKAVALRKGMMFVIREKGAMIGTGYIRNLIQ